MVIKSLVTQYVSSNMFEIIWQEHLNHVLLREQLNNELSCEIVLGDMRSSSWFKVAI